MLKFNVCEDMKAEHENQAGENACRLEATGMEVEGGTGHEGHRLDRAGRSDRHYTEEVKRLGGKW